MLEAVIRVSGNLRANIAPATEAKLGHWIVGRHVCSVGHATLLGIATRPAARAPMDETLAARVTRERGVSRDTRGRPGHRQVTVITRSGWAAACAEAKTELPWTSRRANLLIDGIELRQTIGYELRVGEAVLTITGETRPCKRMDEVHPGLKGALEPQWRGGVTCRVVRSGNIAVGCNVILERKVSRRLIGITHIYSRHLYKSCRRLLGRFARKMGFRRRKPSHTERLETWNGKAGPSSER